MRYCRSCPSLLFDARHCCCFVVFDVFYSIFVFFVDLVGVVILVGLVVLVILVVFVVVIVSAKVGDCNIVVVARLRCLTPGITVIS